MLKICRLHVQISRPTKGLPMLRNIACCAEILSIRVAVFLGIPQLYFGEFRNFKGSAFVRPGGLPWPAQEFR
jgi:hypothetical protein